ncbi:MAG: hypothetical protein N3D15_07690 [Syntrophorhabdaceae bacterium]|nr:hypothetical protein [Syntrophorhabdaceae bacterium]
MDQKKKKAIILILIGVLLPIVFLFFTSGYMEGAGFIKNLLNIKIVINLFGKTIGIPYRFILAIGVIIVYAGITVIIKKEEEE